MVASRPTRNARINGMITWRAGCGDESHVRFGGRARETDQQKRWNRARVRPYTEHPTEDGKLYLCAVKDVCSNRIVGYSIDSRMKSRLAVTALNNAVARRGEVAGCVLHTELFSSWRGCVGGQGVAGQTS